MVAKIQDVILPHEHYKLLIVRAERFVTIDETLDEPQEESDNGGLHSHRAGNLPATPAPAACPPTRLCSNELEVVAS